MQKVDVFFTSLISGVCGTAFIIIVLLMSSGEFAYQEEERIAKQCDRVQEFEADGYVYSCERLEKVE